MKKLTRLMIILFAMFAFVACSDDDDAVKIDNGAMGEVTVGGLDSIKVLLDNTAKQPVVGVKIEQDIVLEGRITTSNSAGNLPNGFYVQLLDKKETFKVSAYLTDVIVQEMQVGQRIKINVKGAYVGLSYDDYLIGAAPDDKYAVKSFSAAQIEEIVEVVEGDVKSSTPEAMSLADFTAKKADYKFKKGLVVEIPNVQFVDADKAKTYHFGDKSFATTTLTDAKGNTIGISTYKNATFKAEKVKGANSGTVTAALSTYKGDLQLILRSTADLDFTADRFDVTTPSQGTPEGTKEAPLALDSAIKSNGGAGSWVKGFIVGTINGKSIDAANFTSFTSNSNLLIAASADETDPAKCLTVQLSSGKIRDDLNLVDNAANHKKEVKLRGDLSDDYFSQAGIKSVDAYVLGDKEYLPTEASGFFVENFTTDKGQFKVVSVTGDLTWVWGKYNTNTYMKMTGFDDAAKKTLDNEDWLISPAIDLTGKTGVKLFVNYTAKLFGADFHTANKIMISSDYDGTSNPSTQGTWEELTGHKAVGVSNWETAEHTFNLDAKYEGKTIYYAFKHVAAGGKGGTIQINKTSVSE